MTLSGDTLVSSIREAVTSIGRLEAQLRETQAQVHGLGFFARGFVEKDISGATGRSFADWIKGATRLRDALEAALSGDGKLALPILNDEMSRIAVLRQYLQRAPQKINMVPAAVLKPQQRSDFLASVKLQEQSLEQLESQLASISGSLSQV